MPSIFTHAIVPATLALAAGRSRIPVRIAVAGVALAMLPDADVATFRMGIDYASQWGHRGASHSLIVAVVLALLTLPLLNPPRKGLALAFLFMAAASHGLLDALTSGVYGPALLWPWSQERLFFPVRPIRVSPIGAAFFTPRGMETIWSELEWVWLPCLLATLPLWLIRRFRAPAASGRDSGPVHQSPD